MKARFNILCIFLLILSNVNGQVCDCAGNLKVLQNKIKSNYAGFDDKVNKTSKTYYNKYFARLLRDSEGAGIYSCVQIMAKYLNWFKDGHLGVNLRLNALSDDSIRSIFANVPRMNFNTDSLERNFSLGNPDPIEGYWELKNASVSYKIAITRSKANSNNFVGIVVTADNIYWQKNQVKLTVKKKGDLYQVEMYKRDHTVAKIPWQKIDGVMEQGQLGTWVKVFPVQKNEIPEPKIISFAKLADSQSLLTIPYFDIFHKHTIDSVLTKNREAIVSSNLLIIDIRGNTGGNSGAYSSLLPYIYTNPVRRETSIIKSSPDNIQFYKNLLSKTDISENGAKRIKEVISRLEANIGKMVNFADNEKIRMDSVLAYPRRVALMVDERCASAAELFILTAKQSRKVKIFGTNTAGGIDYGDAIERQDLPCKFFVYTYPISKRLGAVKAKLDDIGIRPDVPIPGNTNDWIKYIREYFEKSE